jgi:hypothetical protein
VSEKHFRLEAQRADGQPKCANCAFWNMVGRGMRDDAETSGHTSAHCILNNHATLDLSVCSGWRTADTQQEVIE